MFYAIVSCIVLFFTLALFTRTNYNNAVYAARQSMRYQNDKNDKNDKESLFSSSIWCSDIQSRPNT